MNTRSYEAQDGSNAVAPDWNLKVMETLRDEVQSMNAVAPDWNLKLKYAAVLLPYAVNAVAPDWNLKAFGPVVW